MDSLSHLKKKYWSWVIFVFANLVITSEEIVQKKT